MRAERELLEGFRALMARQAWESAPYVPATSGVFRRIAESVERLLNLLVAADAGLVPDLEVCRAAHTAVQFLDAYEERVPKSEGRTGRYYVREYEALERLAQVVR
jgi:hypothetical protein